jgi:hypothetical protein
MKKRLIDLSGDERPILNIESYGRTAPPLTRRQLVQISLTVRRAPEVMVKVSGGARTVGGVEQHMSYIGREGALGLETDMGEVLSGKGVERSVVEDWNLHLDAAPQFNERSIRKRQTPKLVHNLIFSMATGDDHSRADGLRQSAQTVSDRANRSHRAVASLNPPDSDRPPAREKDRADLLFGNIADKQVRHPESTPEICNERQ